MSPETRSREKAKVALYYFDRKAAKLPVLSFFSEHIDKGIKM